MGKLTDRDQNFLTAANGWLELGNYEEAHQELESISLENHLHPEVLKVRVRLFELAGRWADAGVIAGMLTRFEPGDMFGYLYLGRSLHRLQRYPEAIQALTTATDKFETEWELAYQLAGSLCQSGDLKNAYVWLERAIKRAGKTDIRLQALANPDLEPLWQRLGET